MEYDNRTEEYTFRLSFPRWTLWVFVGCVSFGVGFGAGRGTAVLDERSAHEAGRRVGYEDGRASCANDSRAAKAANWIFGSKG